MANIFDQFDQPQRGNVFDQFDAPADEPKKTDEAKPKDKPKDAKYSYAGPSDYLADILSETGGQIASGARAVAAPFGSEFGKLTELQRLGLTGRALLGIPQIGMSWLTGPARAIGGHALSDLEHLAGTVINPEVAAKDDPKKMYEQAAADAETALSALRPRLSGATGTPSLPAPQGPVMPRTAALDLSGLPKAPEPALPPMVAASERLREQNLPVDVPQVLASESPTMQRVGQVSSNIPVVGQPVSTAMRRTASGLGEAVGGVADRLGEGRPVDVARDVRSTLQGAADTEAAAQRGEAAVQDAVAQAKFNRAQREREQQIAVNETQAETAARTAVGDATPQQAGQTAIETVRDAERGAQNEKNRLYREAGQQEGTIAADAVPGATRAASQAMIEHGHDLDELTPAANRAMDILRRFGRAGEDAATATADLPEPVGVTLGAVERIRQRLNSTLRKAAPGSEDQLAVRRIINAFDDWHDAAMNSDAFTGSPDALASYQRARDANTAWRRNFGFDGRDDADRLLQRIVRGEAQPAEVGDWLTGGRKGTPSRLFDRMMVATGDNPELRTALRGAMYRKLTGGGEGVQAFGVDKTAKNIHGFLNDNDMAARLYPDAADQALMRGHADAMTAARDQRAAAAADARANAPQPTTIEPGQAQQLAKDVLSGRSSDEALHNAMIGFAQAKGGDAKTMLRMWAAMSKEQRGNFAATLVDRLGQSAATGQFEPGLFVTQWNKLSREAKTLWVNNTQHRQALEDIAEIAGKFKDVERRFGNISGTAQSANFYDIVKTALTKLGLGGGLVATTGAAAGGLLSPVAALNLAGTGTGLWSAAKLLASPAGASAASKWSRAYEALAGAAMAGKPSAGKIAAFFLASRNLKNNAEPARRE